MHEKHEGETSPGPTAWPATYASGAPVLMAALRGQLVVDDGCLVVGDDVGRHQLVVFPAAEVAWDGQVLEYRGRRYRSGDLLEAVGGVMEPARLHGLRVPEAWASVETAFVVAPSSGDAAQARG